MMQDRNIREYMTTVKCSVCGEYYEFDNVSIVGHQDEVWLLSVFCSGCQTRGLVAALVKEAKKGKTQEAVSEKGERLAEELSPASADVSAPVSMDDVLDMHNFLRRFDGDFSKLLADN